LHPPSPTSPTLTGCALGIDQGTSSTKGALVDMEGRFLASFRSDVPPPTINERSALQHPGLILESVRAILSQALEWSTQSGSPIRAAGLACQRSGVLAWKDEGCEPLTEMMTWADTSTRRIIEDLGSTGQKISERTGIPTIPNFAAGKIAHLQHEHAVAGARVGTLDSFLIAALGGRGNQLTDDSMAARTMLYDLRELDWSDELCRFFRVDRRRLPEIRCSVDTYPMFDEIPVRAAVGDQQAALLGQLRSADGVLLNLGSICSLMVPTGRVPVFKPGLMSSVWFSRRSVSATDRNRNAWYLAELTSSTAGAVLKRLLAAGPNQLATTPQELSDRCFESLAADDHVALVSHAGAINEPNYPHTTPDVVITKGEVSANAELRGYVDNVGNFILEMIEQLEAYRLIFTAGSRELNVSGGGSDVSYLLQYIADCANVTVRKFDDREATARGAALLSLARGDDIDDLVAMNSHRSMQSFEPKHIERREKYLKWKKLRSEILAGRIPPMAKVIEPH
jgi:glycerol kinase